ncbi:hypothetical protein WA588_001748, partial [Blastocystis sp. NMH]
MVKRVAFFLCQLLLIFVSGSRYVYRDYNAMVRTMKEIAQLYPELVEVNTVEEEYGLTSSLQCGKTPCYHWYLRLFNRRIHGNVSAVPQMFLSGELHGDERVGPTAVIEYAIFLLQNRAYYDSTYRKASLRERVHFAESTFHPHYASILDSRDIFIMPMTNAWGYYFKQRTERGIDVNRDFPFDYTSPPYNCFQSESSRAVQELYYHNMFMATITFHGGMQSITYEWGDGYNKQLRAKSPDHFAMKSVSELLNQFSNHAYLVGATNDVVYPVRGGMEEWGYAGSWFNTTNAVATVPSTCRTYPVRMTQLSNRCMTLLVEATNVKTPREATLGDREQLFARGDKTPVNTLLRQCLLLSDVLRPSGSRPEVVNGSEGDDGNDYGNLSNSGYSSQSNNDNNYLSNNDNSSQSNNDNSSQSNNENNQPSNNYNIIHWNVDGCFHVDWTELRIYPFHPSLARLLEVKETRELKDDEYTLLAQLVEKETPRFVSARQTASRRETTSLNPVDAVNQLSFNTTVPQMKGESLLFSVSSVDVFFQDVLPERNPKVPPQSLFVWSRNSSWRGERNDGTRRLWGRSLVFSVPVKYGEEEDPPESRGIEVVALSYWEDGKEDIAVRTIRHCLGVLVGSVLILLYYVC